MDLKSLGDYYVWAEEKMLSAIEKLSDEEFIQKHEGLGRSVRELAEHLYVTYASLDLPPTQETWTTLTEEAQVMGRGELLEHWIASTKKFAEDIVTDSRTEMELPVSKEKKLKVDIDNYYLLLMYYFDVLTDMQVNQLDACKGAEIFNKQSYYVDLDFDCEEVPDVSYYDIYGSVVEPDICLD